VIVIKYLYIGIDDTDSPDGMCTTYLASQIINEFKDNAIELVDYPRLIRLNPFARFKTRGNGGVSLKILNNEKADLAREIVLNEVEKLSMFDCDNTNPGVIFYDGEITEEMENYAFRAIYEFITIEEAEKFIRQADTEKELRIITVGKMSRVYTDCGKRDEMAKIISNPEFQQEFPGAWIWQPKK
jgi:tRNA(Ile2)-agmatinylcytidine synthase